MTELNVVVGLRKHHGDADDRSKVGSGDEWQGGQEFEKLLMPAEPRVRALAQFVNQLTEPLLVVDGRGVVLAANDCLRTTLRLDFEDDGNSASLVGQNLAELLAPGHRVLLPGFVSWYFARREDRGHAIAAEFDLILGDGTRERVAMRWMLLDDNCQSHVAVIAVEVVPALYGAATGVRHSRDPVVSTRGAIPNTGFGSGSTERRADHGVSTRAVLSSREREVMMLILDGNRVSTIANSLYLSENTVRNHLKRVYRKLGVCSIGELREAFHAAHAQPAQKSGLQPAVY
jgi:DNA-binding CsgD family transcriptional regulator